MANIEVLQKIVDISSKIGPGYVFNMKNYLDGHQLLWKNQYVSIIWRSVGWDEDRIEVFNPKLKKAEYFYLDEIKSSDVQKINIGNF